MMVQTTKSLGQVIIEHALCGDSAACQGGIMNFCWKEGKKAKTSTLSV